MRKLLYTVALFVMASACSTKPESKPYNWEDDLYQRLLTDFCMTESQVKDYIRKYIPDVTDEQMRQWEASSFGVHDAGWRETLFPQCRT